MTNPVYCSFPDRALSQNARVHWSVRARATKASRTEACYATHEAGHAKKPYPTPLHITVAITPPHARYDDHNINAMCKAIIDGFADAVGINDKHIKPHYEHLPPCKPGSVTITPIVGGTDA